MLRLCQQLIRGGTAEDYVNDALEKMVFVRENLNPPEALRLFATAQLLLRQQLVVGFALTDGSQECPAALGAVERGDNDAAV